MSRISTFRHSIAACLSFLLTFQGFLLSTQVSGYVVEVAISDQYQQPLAGILVVISQDQNLMKAPLGTTAQMTQQDRSFKPKILIIQAGTAVHFPNKDPIKHHVYSFSEPKTFQLKLYRDQSPNPILFDTPGIVALGCNIHDWMLGYIYVTDTPYYATTNAKGLARLDVPEGHYRLHYWHPLLDPKDLAISKTIQVKQTFSIHLNMQHETLKPIKAVNSKDIWDEY